MQFKTSILSVLLMASATVFAAPQNLDDSSLLSKRDNFQTVSHENDYAHQALAKCKELNIDPYGKMPTDYDSHDVKAKKIKFSKGSNFGYWAAAQGAITKKGLGRRSSRDTNVNIIMWDNTDCNHNGNAVYWYDMGLNAVCFNQNPDRTNYSLQITAGFVPEWTWRIWVKKWNGPGTTTCRDVGNPNLSIWGGPGCAKNLPGYDCAVIQNYVG